MNEFLRAAYGDPCRDCGFDWSVEPATCVAIVSNAPARFRALLAGQEGQAAHATLQWNATAYVVHVADVLRIWADRVAAAALGPLIPLFPTTRGDWVMSVAMSACPSPAHSGHWSERLKTGRRPSSSLNRRS